MLLLARLLIIGISLFLFLIYVLKNFDTKDDVILNKIYIFAFIFSNILPVRFLLFLLQDIN